MTECIHGLETTMCDVCSPRAIPEPVRAARGSARTAGARSPSSPIGLSVNRAEQRVYLVVSRARLAEVLTTLPDEDWRDDLGAVGDPFRWPDAGGVEKASDLIVLVAALGTPGQLQLVATANEPARRAVREQLDEAGYEVRVVLQPAWWVAA